MLFLKLLVLMFRGYCILVAKITQVDVTAYHSVRVSEMTVCDVGFFLFFSVSCDSLLSLHTHVAQGPPPFVVPTEIARVCFCPV